MFTCINNSTLYILLYHILNELILNIYYNNNTYVYGLLPFLDLLVGFLLLLRLAFLRTVWEVRPYG